MTDFNAATANALFAALVTKGEKLGPFRGRVITHEPKSAPTSLPALALWWDGVTPLPQMSGVAEVAGVITFAARVYQAAMTQKPENDIDKGLLANTALFLGALCESFTLGSTVLAVDLLGISGQMLTARSGFISHDGTLLRVAQIPIPVIVDNLWLEVA